jgi:7-cyano-7-deazaguanine reductase
MWTSTTRRCCFPSRALPSAPKSASRALPFFGADIWTAFELSWLTPRGKPQVALAHITVPCETPHIIESKSFKLYLNSYNNTRFASADEVRERLRSDISRGRVARRHAHVVGGCEAGAARAV